GGWGISAVVGLMLAPDSLGFAAHNFWLSLGIQLGIQAATALVLLLIAWALVPGVHVRHLSGLLVASILIAVFTYAAVAFTPALGVGF
ncbi:MAG TPA: hypothetical protein VMZ90_04925, partial [Vicinamibacterales bacterium]|nr:hypothetical protein [Vicinamibacterales bacterium]